MHVTGEPGLMVCRITDKTKFDGYVGNKDQTEKKILRNVLVEGDAYLNSGDLMINQNAHVYFSDRLGDTFRYFKHYHE